MNNLDQAIWVEILKARRSRIPIVSALGMSLIPLAGGFFIFVLKNPDLARRVGLISAKAHLLVGTADWPTYLNFLILALGAGGALFFSFIVSWVFGREFADRTVKDLLALPTTRSSIVAAKFILVAIWTGVLTLIMLGIGLVVGFAISLPPVNSEIIRMIGANLIITSCLTILLLTPIAFIASAGHGYLAPMAFALLVEALAQFVGIAGWGEYFPWAIPALYAQGQYPGIVSFIIIAATSLAGLSATFRWWERADQTR
jgi:ABC-2 type transport system permease protein